MPIASVSLVYAVAATIYGWQAWAQRSPWIFPDETQHAQTAEAIAGVASASIGPIPGILYSALIAPAWFLHDPVASYDVAKFIGVLAMCSAAVPAYLLARLLVRSRLALLAAIAVVAIPGMAYSSLLMQEALAYPYATLVFYVLTSALVSGQRARLAAAFVLALLGPLIRTELVVLPIIAVIAGSLHVWFGDWARRRRARWTLAHWVLATGVLLCALAACVALGAAVSTAWHTALDHPLRFLRYVVLGIVPFTVGVGILPVIVSPAALLARRTERDRVLRAFAFVFAAGMLALLVYVGAKEAFLASKPEVFGPANLLGERNLIYLSPLVFTALVVWMESRRINRAVLAGTAVIVLSMLAWVPYVFAYLAPDSPTVITIAHLAQKFDWSHAAVRYGLIAAVVVATLLVAVASRGRSRLARNAVLSATAIVVVGWGLTCEIYASNRSREIGDGLARAQPRPFDWIDRATNGRPAIYLGEEGLRAPEIYSLGFWNRALTRSWGVQTTPYPGVIPAARIVSVDGSLSLQPRARYVVADRQIEVAGDRIAHGKRWNVYRVGSRLRLRAFQAGLLEDGWSGRTSSYTRFSAEGKRSGHVRVWLSLRGWCGPDVGSKARVVVGTLAHGDAGLSIAHVTNTWRAAIHPCRIVSATLPTPPPPFRVEVHVAPTFVPAKLNPASLDTRQLGAQVAYRFTPDG
jgi:hypothetical protein